MAWLSRFVNMIERMVTSLDGNHALEEEDASGLWMSTADALDAAPAAPGTFAAPHVVPLPADPPPPEPQGEARVVPLPVAPEAAPPESLDDAAIFESPEPAVDAAPPEEFVTQPDDTPAETADQPAAVEHIAAPAGSAEDVLSMFRETSVGTEYSGLTKDIEDITAQELLDEARAVLDLLAPNRVPSEEDAIA
jgi:hypothetical protein